MADPGRKKSIAQYLRKAWRFSLIVTLPMTIFFFLWAYQTYRLYTSFFPELNKAEVEEPLVAMGEVIFAELMEGIWRSFYRENAKVEFNIFIPQRSLNELNQDLPDSGFEFKRGFLLYPDGRLNRIQLRYRGDHAYHWLFPRKSYRIKSRKQRLYQGFRTFNLITPTTGDLINIPVTYALARTMTISAPASYLTELKINREYAGAKVFVEQISEGFLRRNHLMPGDIYRCDNEGEKVYWGSDSSCFQTPEFWEKVASDNQYPEHSVLPLVLMIQQLGKGDTDLIDKNAFGKFAAMIDLTRSRHVNQFHNWYVYYDLYREKFYPIAWDVGGWTKRYLETDIPGKSIINTLLWHTLYSDDEFLVVRRMALNEFYRDQKEKFLIAVEAFRQEAHQLSFNVQYHSDFSQNVFFVEDIQKAADDYASTIKNELDKFQQQSVEKKGVYAFSQIANGIRISVDKQPLSRILIQTRDAPTVETALIRYQTENEGTLSVHLPLEAVKTGLQVTAPFSPQSRVSEQGHSYAPATFDVVVAGLDEGKIQAVIVTEMDTSKTLVGIPLLGEIPSKARPGRYHLFDDLKVSQPEVWTGRVLISGFRTIENDVIIRPGTEIELSPAAVLKFKGRVMAVGEPEAPILFKKGGLENWGAVVLFGPRAGGSTFDHCVFQGGSGSKGDTYSYIGMLSIHDVKGVKISHTEFQNNTHFDDMVHVIYSEVQFLGCKFMNAYRDALDIDISKVIIEGCEFSNAGNDNVDFMDSEGIILDSTMSGGEDKGVSIGEGSKVLVINTLFTENRVGLEVKDRSNVRVYNSEFSGNQQSLNAYHKNWHYEAGGILRVFKSVFRGNQVSPGSADGWKIEIIDSTIPKVSAEVIQLDHLSDDKAENEFESNGYFGKYISRVRFDIRGRISPSTFRPPRKLKLTQ
ncbi:MAG: CotH kinase family protein [Nitrososphaerales archaeon]